MAPNKMTFDVERLDTEQTSPPSSGLIAVAVALNTTGGYMAAAIVSYGSMTMGIAMLILSTLVSLTLCGYLKMAQATEFVRPQNTTTTVFKPVDN